MGPTWADIPTISHHHVMLRSSFEGCHNEHCTVVFPGLLRKKRCRLVSPLAVLLDAFLYHFCLTVPTLLRFICKICKTQIYRRCNDRYFCLQRQQLNTSDRPDGFVEHLPTEGVRA